MVVVNTVSKLQLVLLCMSVRAIPSNVPIEVTSLLDLLGNLPQSAASETIQTTEMQVIIDHLKMGSGDRVAVVGEWTGQAKHHTVHCPFD